MASISTSKKSGTRRLLFRVSNCDERSQINLGRIPSKEAQGIKRRVEALIASKRSNSAIDGETASWLAGIDTKLRASLVKHGLAAPIAARQDFTLIELVDAFFASQVVKPSTLASYKQSTDSLLEHFGPDTHIRHITAQQADGWRKALHESPLAQATVSKRINTAKSLFARAIKWGALEKCPLRHVKRGSQVNSQRLVYVEREKIQLVLKACPDDQCRAVVVLARFAGLRCPSEMCDLRWGDVDFTRSALRVCSIKLEAYGEKAVRDVPMSLEVRHALRCLNPGSEGDLVLPRIGTCETNMRTMLEKAIIKADVESWPRLFQNLRASCEMDWADAAGHHPAAKWIGHSLEVSAKHYVRVRDVHFEKVTGSPASDANNDAQMTHMMTRHQSAEVSNNPQHLLQSQEECGVVLLSADPCRDLLRAGMGGEGLEPPKAYASRFTVCPLCRLSIHPILIVARTAERALWHSHRDGDCITTLPLANPKYLSNFISVRRPRRTRPPSMQL